MDRRVKNAAVLAVLFGVAGIGCNGKATPPLTTAGDAGPPDSGPTAQACSDFAQAECAKRSECSNGAEITKVFGTMDTCVSRETLSCTLGLQAPDTGNTAALVEQCATTFPTVACADFFSTNLPSPCVAVGSKAMGAPCAFSAQCSSTYCNANKTSTCGTCGGPPPAASSCVSSNCARGQECSAIQQCVVPAAAVSACDNNSNPCEFGLSCSGNTNGTPGTCVQGWLDAGTACGGSMGTCDGSSGVTCFKGSCVAINYASDGAPCGSIDGGAFGSCTAGTCYGDGGPSLSGQTGLCRASVADGQPCNIDDGPNCLIPARCVVTGGGAVGVCTLPSGMTCG